MIRVAAERLHAEFMDLLDKVEQGDEVQVERAGKVVAWIVAPRVPAAGVSAGDDPVKVLLEAREGASLGGLSWKELRDEGRR